MSSDPPDAQIPDEAPPSRDQSGGQPPIITAQGTSNAVLDPPPPAGHRLHPSSLLFDVLSHFRTYLIPAALGLFGAASGNYFWSIIAAVVFVPALLTSVFRYFTLRCSIQDGKLVVTKGLLFRSVRTVPVERIQNIDLVQNVLHRLFKVAEVRVETASGTEPEATLRVLAMNQVVALRSAIFGKQAATPTKQTGPAGDGTHPTVEIDSAPPAQALLRIPPIWLVKAGLASNRGMLIIGIAAGIAYQFDFWEQIDFDRARQLLPHSGNTVAVVIESIALVILVLLLLRLLGIVWFLLRFHGYQLERDGEDLQISCGLLTKVSATVPRRRVQFISVHRTLIMRWMGLSSIRLETAGGAGKQNEDAKAIVSRRWFVPVVPDQQVPKLIAAVRPGLNWDMNALDWKPVSRRASRRLIRLAVLHAFLIAAIAMVITRPWGWVAGAATLPILILWAIKKSRSMRYARTPDGVVYRSGVLNRKTSMTFFEKIQTLRIDQSPFDRRWKMASLSVDTAAAGPAEHRIRIPLLDEQFARKEYRELAVRAASHQPVYA